MLIKNKIFPFLSSRNWKEFFKQFQMVIVLWESCESRHNKECVGDYKRPIHKVCPLKFE